MPPPVLGEDFDLLVAAIATPTAFSAVNDTNTYRRGSSREAGRRSVFMRVVPYIVTGRRQQTMEFGGYLNLTDAGQALMRAAEMNNTDVVAKVLFDGTNGFTQQCKVTSFTHEASPDDLQGITWVLDPVADPVIVGTGPIL